MKPTTSYFLAGIGAGIILGYVLGIIDMSTHIKLAAIAKVEQFLAHSMMYLCGLLMLADRFEKIGDMVESAIRIFRLRRFLGDHPVESKSEDS